MSLGNTHLCTNSQAFINVGIKCGIFNKTLRLNCDNINSFKSDLEVFFFIKLNSWLQIFASLTNIDYAIESVNSKGSGGINNNIQQVWVKTNTIQNK